MSKETVAGKGLRLWIRGKVRVLQQDQGSLIALVKGDHDFYLVRLNGEEGSCQCKWFQFKGSETPCSHIEAVRDEVNTALLV